MPGRSVLKTHERTRWSRGRSEARAWSIQRPCSLTRSCSPSAEPGYQEPVAMRTSLLPEAGVQAAGQPCAFCRDAVAPLSWFCRATTSSALNCAIPSLEEEEQLGEVMGPGFWIQQRHRTKSGSLILSRTQDFSRGSGLWLGRRFHSVGLCSVPRTSEARRESRAAGRSSGHTGVRGPGVCDSPTTASTRGQ